MRLPETLKRQLSPELLKSLPADDPQAIHSRRDLRRVNAIMLQSKIMRRLFLDHLPRPPRRIIELGGGGGDFVLRIARRSGMRSNLHPWMDTGSWPVRSARE
jgi:hypothetical protein